MPTEPLKGLTAVPFECRPTADRKGKAHGHGTHTERTEPLKGLTAVPFECRPTADRKGKAHGHGTQKNALRKDMGMKKFLKGVVEFLALVLGCDCKSRRDAVDAGICDFSGQGRNKYGK